MADERRAVAAAPPGLRAAADAVAAAGPGGHVEAGPYVILPSSCTGGPRSQRAMYHDSMAVVNQVGNPSAFITFTANPEWEEIVEALPPHHRGMGCVLARRDGAAVCCERHGASKAPSAPQPKVQHCAPESFFFSTGACAVVLCPHAVLCCCWALW